LTSNNTSAYVKAGNGFTKEHAAEAPEEMPLIGPFAGENPGSPVEGTTEDMGDIGPAPSNSGAGAGPKTVSFATVVGGAMRGGNSSGPVTSFEIYL